MPDIDIGAARSDGTLRLWLAQTAVEKGEAILTAQLGAVGRLGSNATSVLGWSVTIALALIATLSSALLPVAVGTAPAAPTVVEQLALPAGVALAAVLASAITCVRVVWPGYWHPPGHAPDLVMDAPYDSALEVLEAMALGYADAITTNTANLTLLEVRLRWAWLLFAASPVGGLATYVLQAPVHR